VLKEGTTNEHELLYKEDVFDIVGCAMEKNCLLKIDNRQRTQIWNNINKRKANSDDKNRPTWQA
jgi:hypothetical protein